MDERQLFIELLESCRFMITELCESFGISRGGHREGARLLGVSDAVPRRRPPVLGVDTMILIYHFEEHEHFGPAATVLLQAAEEGRCRLLVSVLGRLETRVAPKRHGRDDLCRRYRELFQGFPNLEVIDVDAQVVEIDSDLRAAHGLRPRTPSTSPPLSTAAPTPSSPRTAAISRTRSMGFPCFL